MGVAEILYANMGVLLLQFILTIVVIWYLWYIYTDLQNNYDDLVVMIKNQNAILLEISQNDTDIGELIPQRALNKIKKREKYRK